MSEVNDLIIIGAGAAGLSAAQYGARADLKVLVLEEMAPGGQALLIDKLENYPGIREPISGFELAEAMKAQAVDFGARFESQSALSVNRDGERFVVSTTGGDRFASSIVIATGAAHRKAGVPGEDELSGRGVSYCATCDGPFFRGKRILVVGGGDAACDEAAYLSKIAGELVMVHRRERFRAQKALADRTLANPAIKVRFSTVVGAIKGNGKVERVELVDVATGATTEEPFDAVFVFVGSDPRASLVPNLAKDESGYIVTDGRMMTSEPGVFAAGDVRASPFRQVVTAASDGAVAAHYAARYIDETRGNAY
jgi:thioredoxin reductase (NADPH)